jgi:hypothetical protein
MARVEDLPLLLGGPIIRRAEPQEVVIWIATKESVLTANVVLVKQPPRGEELKTTTTVRQQQLGANLHIALLSVKAERGELPTDVLLGYTFTLKTDSGKHALATLVAGDVGLAYAGQKTPTFYLSTERSRILHASCRKPHAEGYDALRALDERMGEVPTNLDKRPGVLFLTGDQIYADDVAEPLLDHLTELSALLLGWDERVPFLSGGTGPKGVRPVRDIKYKDRNDFVRNRGAFTTSAAGHVIGLGEFCAMYLAVWNPELFPKLDPDGDLKQKSDIQSKLTGVPSLKLTSKFWLRTFGETLPYARRLLANIPTYMIFDDHDVTDDWNLRGSWEKNVRKSPTGRRIVANALTAYWAFQAWGNNPDGFQPGFVDPIVKYLDEGRTGGPKAAEAAASDFEDAVLDFHDWEFFAPTDPPTVFIDCRTRRAYDDPLPPQILGDDGLKAMEKTAKKAKFKRGRPLTIVSSLPVYTVWLGELVAEKVLVPREGAEKWDQEAWRANHWGFARFMAYIVERLAPSHCVFLGGDVHFAFTVQIRYVQYYAMWELAYKAERDGSGDVVRSIFTQLTSSAAKNEEEATRTTVGEYLGGAVKRIGPVASTAFLGPSEDAAVDEAVTKMIRDFSWKDVMVPPALRVPKQSLDLPQPDSRIHERFGLVEPSGDDVRVWEHVVEYVVSQQRSSPIFGQNNAGEVVIGSDVVTHTLWNWTGEKAISNTANASLRRG